MSLLHIGDIISLYADGFLSTLGLVDDRCVLQPATSKSADNGAESSGTAVKDPPKKFRDCLFKVCIQHKYDVQSELWRSGHLDEELYKKLYAAAKSEQETNHEKNQLKRGTVVKYEDTIQLLHIKSNKYITVNSKASALEDKDATRVYLSSNGNEESWLKVRSPYKYRSNGEDVVCESIALVSDVSRGALGSEEALYLHASSYCLMDNPDCLEINASRQSTSWDIKPFLDYTEDSEDYLKGGDVVRLFHTDQEKFLTLDTYNSVDHVFLRSTDRAKATSATSSKALWEVEVVHADPCRASLARWNSLIRLKHLATEQFLAAEQDDDQTPDPMRSKLRQKGAPVYKLISMEFCYDFATLFEFDSTTMNVNCDDYIPIQSNITLKHFPTSTYVHSTNIYIDKDKKKSCMSKVGCAQSKGLDEVFAVIPVAATEIRDLDFVSDAFLLLNEAHDLIKEDDDQQGGRTEAHRKLAELLPEIIHFIANKENEPRKSEKALVMVAEEPNRERQKLLREQNVLKLLFDILELEAQQSDTNIAICRLCYRVLMLSFQDYRKNQEYIVKWDKFMQLQFGLDIYAEFTYSSLFHSNRNLLEKSLTSKDVEVFVNLIRSKHQSNFLDCLSDLCISSNGSVSNQTQRLISESILSKENSDILIETLQTTTSNQIMLSTEHWSPSLAHYDEELEKLSRFRKPLKEVVLAARNNHERDQFVLDYYRHQLDLFSAMCIARQSLAINIISEKISLQLIQYCISDAELPCELRASFCRLLLHLYLIRDPQKPISPINLRRNWKGIPEKINVDIYDHYEQLPRLKQFEETMEFVELYLSDLSARPSSIFYNNERNKLTSEVVKLNRELAYFGFYRLSDLLRLGEILLILLEDDKNQQRLVMATKTKIIETLQYSSEVRLDYMITSLLTIFKSNQKSGSGGDSTSQIAIKTNQALDQHLNEVNLDSSQGRKFVNVLLHLVQHDCPDLVSASLKLLLNYRSQRSRILETFKQIELVDAPYDLIDKFRKLHPLIERSDKYIRKGHDENHEAVNEVLVQDPNLISYIVQHIQYLIRNKDEKSLTKDLLRSLRDLIPLEAANMDPNQASNQQRGEQNGGHSRGGEGCATGIGTGDNGRRQYSSTPSSLADIQNKLDTHGTSSLVIELIAMGSSLCEEKVRERSALVFKDTLALGIALLEGGNQLIQGSIHDKLTKKSEQDKSERFFEVLSNRMNLAQQALSPSSGNSSGEISLKPGVTSVPSRMIRGSSLEYSSAKLLSASGDSLLMTDSLRDDLESTVDTTEKVLAMTSTVQVQVPVKFVSRSTKRLPELIEIMRPILRFLQLLCEDHNLTMQNFMHNQQNKTSYNLVAKTLVFLNCICGSKEGSLGHKLGEYIKENNVDLINQTLRTLTEYCQGPCVENQRCILMHESNGIDMIRSLILDKIEPLDNLRMDLVLELKDNASKLLLALMESCSNPQHAARILREASLTKKLIDVSISYYHEQDDYDDSFAELSSEEALINSSTDGMVRPRDVGHKVFILCHQLVQQYNMIPPVTSVHTLAKIPTSEEATNAANKCEPSKKDTHLREATALRYYESHTAQIEIVRGNREMERVVFPVPQICEYLTNETKSNVYQNTEQDERGSKIPSFFQKIDNLFDEMKWQRELQTKPLLHSIARYMSLWSSIEFKLSVLVTALVLFCVSKCSNPSILTNTSAVGVKSSSVLPSPFSTLLAIACSTLFVYKPKIPHLWTLFLCCTTIYLTQVVGGCSSLKILGLFLELVTVMHLFSVLINRGIINKPLQQIVLESDVTFHGSYLIVCTLGFLVNPLFYPFLLPPSLIRREETLRNVIKSVTKNAYSILMTGLLGLIIILLYTIITYLYFAEDFVIDLDDGTQYKPCSCDLWECFATHAYYGLRDGGGIGERFRDSRLDPSISNIIRLVDAMSFFLVVNLMILQLVYCIIVDTFATLRSDKQQKEEILRNTCFVCGLDRSSFENRAVTFEDHIQTEHNLWHYLYFIVLIKTKSRTELSGPESFVHDNKDHSWLPRMRAMSLSTDNYTTNYSGQL